MTKPTPNPKCFYPHFREVSTRWNDNDPYGHVNNMVYYAWFDSAVNGYLVDHGALEINNGNIVGLVVKNSCDYFSPLAFPEIILAGIRVGHVGNTSIEYCVGIFRQDGDVASAQGSFVHVYVDRESRKPVAISMKMIEILQPLISP